MKIMLSGGGTAGHITPLLAVAQEILQAEPRARIEFIGQRGDINSKLMSESDLIDACHKVYGGKFRRFHSLNLWQNITNFKVNLLNLRDLFLVLIGFVESVILLLKNRPDAIFFKGGFVVVPIGFAARILRIPYITHDSDPIPGLANRLIASGATKNAVVNEGVRSYPIKKTIVSGIPLDPAYEQRRGASQSKYKKLLKLPSDCQMLLVYAGTQGSKIIDDALELVIPELLNEFPKLHINYVFGRLNEHTLATRYKNLSTNLQPRLHKMTFIDNAYDHIAAADIIVGRAGATSMAEFATVGRACIIVPAEQLTGGHQLMNADIYSSTESVVLVRESELDAILGQKISELLRSDKKRAQLEYNIRRLAPTDAAKILAEEILMLTRVKT